MILSQKLQTTRRREDDLECRDLSKSFYTKKALNEVSLKLEGGKIYGLLGENGSGKTTWMKIISGLTKLHPERFCSRNIRVLWR